MRIIVGHHLWSRVGGGELVNAYLVKSLLEAKHEVAAVSTFGLDKKKYLEWFGLDLTGIKVYTLMPKMLPFFGVYQRLGFYIPLRKAVKKEKPDVVFVDNELYKPILKLKEKLGFRLLEYIHFPFHALRLLRFEPNENRELYEQYIADVKEYHKKYEKGLWKVYFNVFLKFYKRVARDNPFDVADVVMTNSRYIARLTKMLWGGDPVVLYPPVKVRDFDRFCTKTFEEREDTVVMIGRVTPEKRIEDVIDAIAYSETKPVLKVIGGLIPSNIPYKEKIERRAKEVGVRMKIYTNAPRSELIKIASSSKVFVHATKGEHFGIAVVEGMAAGCPVIVHRSGGPYEDIIDHDKYGMSYDSIEELAGHIDRLMTEPNIWKHYHIKSLERAPRFSEQEFATKALRIVENI